MVVYSESTPIMSVCPHLKSYLDQHGTHPFSVIHSNLITCSTKTSRQRKAKECICSICHKHGPRLHACLSCVFFGCYKDHIRDHARENKHNLAVDLLYGSTICLACGDYVYYKDFEVIKFNDRARMYEVMGLSSAFEFWKPSIEEVEALQQHPKRLKVSARSRTGLRGLVNLGNTCFMNCIIQTLTHTPFLRDFFLSENHVCQQNDNNNTCPVCEITSLFQEFYSGKPQPLTLHRLLYMIWTHARHLAGYEQQDAHEFFIAALDVLHRHCRPKETQSQHCTCIIDQIFTGGLQSDVVCQTCRGVSTTIDPFWDISLDLGGTTSNSHECSLEACLERFTKPEHLGAHAKIKCSSCQSYEESTKQLTMRTLPIVASFHLKRFEHSTRFHKKISTFIRFPEFLDMSPFMSQQRNRSNGTCDINSSDHVYTLFAVVNHVGSLDAGHYTAYIRLQQDHWYKCDDHVITPARLTEVLDSEGYLLFYHKRILEYQ